MQAERKIAKVLLNLRQSIQTSSSSSSSEYSMARVETSDVQVVVEVSSSDKGWLK